MPTPKYPQWVVYPRVPEEVYTDRQEFIDRFYKIALDAAGQRSMSTVLLGQRRMGKTEIFIRVVNRLFWEQDYRDPKAVIPVYYKFEDKATDRWEFALNYAENFIRWYIAFRLRKPELLTKEGLSREDLPDFIKTNFESAKGLPGALNLLHSIQKKGVTYPDSEALTLPVWFSDNTGTPIAVFLDEFQNTRLPQYNFDIVGCMQSAVESWSCPHLVTGSAMSILAKEILGRGSLFGRFSSEPIKPLTNFWGSELALKSARYYGANLSEEMAPVVADRCGGNPFYITAVVHQASERNVVLDNEEAINGMLAVDLSSGFIWAELNDQVTRWIERINDYGITKWVLYLSALDESADEEIHPSRIRQELLEREGKDVPLEKIKDTLIKLSRGDLLEYMEFGGWFKKIDDPILLEFLRVWGKVEIERQNYGQIQYNLSNRYQKLKRQISEYKGYLAETFMAQVLWNGQRKLIAGRFFHSESDIQFPWQFFYVRQRMRFSAGPGREVDVIGAADRGQVWVCQSKWVNEKVGRQVLDDLQQQGEWAREDYDPQIMRLWLFAYSGLTAEAELYATEQGILWSSLTEFNELLEHLGMRRLPLL